MSSIPFWFARIDKEATAVGIVCIIFLGLFVVAGVRDILRRKGEE